MTSTSALQAVVVSAASWGASSAVVTAYSWGANGWQAAFGPITANIGVNGFTAAPHENDGYTPVGEYAFTTLFGVNANPGVSFPYVQTTANDHWVDDPNSTLYNTFQTGDAAGRWASAETLSDYSYAAAFDFNQHPVVANGNSAIFLHEGGAPTPGCVVTDRADLLSLLRWLQPTAHPVIVLGVNAAPPPHAAVAPAPVPVAPTGPTIATASSVSAPATAAGPATSVPAAARLGLVANAALSPAGPTFTPISAVDRRLSAGALLLAFSASLAAALVAAGAGVRLRSPK